MRHIKKCNVSLTNILVLLAITLLEFQVLRVRKSHFALESKENAQSEARPIEIVVNVQNIIICVLS